MVELTKTEDGRQAVLVGPHKDRLTLKAAEATLVLSDGSTIHLSDWIDDRVYTTFGDRLHLRWSGWRSQSWAKAFACRVVELTVSTDAARNYINTANVIAFADKQINKPDVWWREVEESFRINDLTDGLDKYIINADVRAAAMTACDGGGYEFAHELLMDYLKTKFSVCQKIGVSP